MFSETFQVFFAKKEKFFLISHFLSLLRTPPQRWPNTTQVFHVPLTTGLRLVSLHKSMNNTWNSQDFTTYHNPRRAKEPMNQKVSACIKGNYEMTEKHLIYLILL